MLVLTPMCFERYWCLHGLDLAMSALHAGRRITLIPVCPGPQLAHAGMAAAGKPGVSVSRWEGNLRDLGLHHQGKAVQSTVKNA